MLGYITIKLSGSSCNFVRARILLCLCFSKIHELYSLRAGKSTVLNRIVMIIHGYELRASCQYQCEMWWMVAWGESKGLTGLLAVYINTGDGFIYSYSRVDVLIKIRGHNSNNF